MYAENWGRHPELKKALTSIPSLMMWDVHDIFDGAGSYPPLLHDSPMMMGLFLAAQKNANFVSTSYYTGESSRTPSIWISRI